MPVSELPHSAERSSFDAVVEYQATISGDDHELQRLVALAADVCDAPMAMVAIGKNDRRHLVVGHNVPESCDVSDSTLGSHDLDENRLFIVEDGNADARFHDDPWVAGDAGVRFYAAAPIVDTHHQTVGCLCVMDVVKRKLDERQQNALRVLGQQVLAQLELRRQRREAGYRQALVEIWQSDLSDRTAAVRRITETASRVLGVERVGLWNFDAGHGVLVLEDLYSRSKHRHDAGDVLRADEFPKYFEALRPARTLALSDAANDPRSSELAGVYLIPNGIGAMLDVPVRTAGALGSVLCHEHVGPARSWSPAEQDFAGSMADLAATVAEASQRRRVERELHDLNDDLEIRIGERTAALEHAIRDLESFNYTVSHDLRAPLRAINGFATVLTEHIDGDLEPEATESLDAIRRNATAMSRLLDDLLAFSRLSRRDVGTGTVDVSAVAREVVRETIDPEDLPATEIRVAETPRATADEELVRQLIAHLLDNALKYSRSRTRRIVEFVGRTDGDFVVYGIHDNGSGFDTRYARHIFDPFTRLDADPSPEGTGVGLAIARRIVERHGGRIWADGRPGDGASFFFSLPAASGGDEPES